MTITYQRGDTFVIDTEHVVEEMVDLLMSKGYQCPEGSPRIYLQDGSLYLVFDSEIQPKQPELSFKGTCPYCCMTDCGYFDNRGCSNTEYKEQATNE